MNVYIYDLDHLDLSFIKIVPGDVVVIKPNLVKEAKETNPDEWECVITSPLVIRKVVMYVGEQLDGTGKIVICDAPQSDSDFDLIRKRAELDEIAAAASKRFNIAVEVVDLRRHTWKNSDGIVTDHQDNQGDPEGAIRFVLNEKSLFSGHRGEGRYYGADYDTKVLNSHHRRGVHEYLVCRTPILADVFICLPKLKTHKKTGVTLSLKNLVGINADKNWLPHHTSGRKGDEFPDKSFKHVVEGICKSIVRNVILKIPGIGLLVSQKLRKVGEHMLGDGHTVVRSGNWYGNDTTWRMVHDLNYCLLYGNPNGTFRDNCPKRYYSVIDGLVGMEGNGPMQGEPKETGLIIGGDDPVGVDIVASRIMGFDWKKLPVIKNAVGNTKITKISNHDIQNIMIISSEKKWNGSCFGEFAEGEFEQYKPHFGWLGHIEWERGTGQ